MDAERLPRPPVAVRDRLGPAHADDGLVRMVEPRVRPPAGRREMRGGQERSVLAIGHRSAAEREGGGPDSMGRTLVHVPAVPSHPEPAGTNLHEVHAVEYNQVLASTPWR